jgi:hypothetical protein
VRALTSLDWMKAMVFDLNGVLGVLLG